MFLLSFKLSIGRFFGSVFYLCEVQLWLKYLVVEIFDETILNRLSTKNY